MGMVDRWPCRSHLLTHENPSRTVAKGERRAAFIGARNLGSLGRRPPRPHGIPTPPSRLRLHVCVDAGSKEPPEGDLEGL